MTGIQHLGQRADPLANRFLELALSHGHPLGSPTFAQHEPPHSPASARALALEIAALGYAYSGSTRDTIHMASLQIRAGEQVLLVGRSGSGKSTLLNLIAGLIDPTSGSVRVAGREMHRLHGAARDAFRGQHVGMIFQTFNLLSGFSALENVLLGLMFSPIPRSEHHARASALLSSLGIERPEADVSRLSVGQQQRVAVARAVACGPALVLADEPTASLDPETAMAAMALIQQACAQTGAALLCVSHDPAMRERFTRIESLESLNAGILTHAATRQGASA